MSILRKKKKRLKLLIIGFLLLLISIFSYIFSYKNFLKKVYPCKFFEIITEASNKFGIDKETIFAVIRTESGFDTNAVSEAGAIGLMQITPETFFWLKNSVMAKKILSEINISKNLYDSYTNIIIGTCFLWVLNKKFESKKTALAAYNAGITTVKKWLNDKRFSNDGKTLKKIPYTETKNYVKKICNAKKIYEKLLKNY